MRKTVTIPADGVKLPVKITGRSIIIESIPTYETVDDVPIFEFNPGSTSNPMYPRNKFPNPQGQFDSIIITGTAESEGDTVTFFSSDECVDLEFNPLFAETVRIQHKATFTKSASNSAQSFTDIELNFNGLLPIEAVISCSPLTASERGVKYAFGLDPVQGKETAGYYLGANAQPLRIEGIGLIEDFRFIAETTDETPLLNVTLIYRA